MVYLVVVLNPSISGLIELQRSLQSKMMKMRKALILYFHFSMHDQLFYSILFATCSDVCRDMQESKLQMEHNWSKI